MFSHSDNWKTWIKCQGSKTPSPPPPPPPPHPADAYHCCCQSSSLTEYATFFLFFSFLSMEFIAELPYKSPRPWWPGCFHTFSCLTIILKTVHDLTTATVTRSSKTYDRVNIKNNFARAPPFLYIFFAVTAYLRRENAQFHVVRRNFLILSERAYGCLKFNPRRAP